MPDGFMAEDQVVKQNLTANAKYAMCYPKDAIWNVTPQKANPPALAGTCSTATLTPNFCPP